MNEFRSMKRAHSPDFEHPPHARLRGSAGQIFHRQRDFQHPAHPDSIEDRIACLGETGQRSNEIGNLAKVICAKLSVTNIEEETIKNLNSKICQCIISYPTRVATYATLIGLISVKHYNVSCQIIQTLHTSYPLYLEAQKWQEALIIIHLLSNMVNCRVIQPSALLSLFQSLLDVTQEHNIPQTRSDYYVYTVLSSLPYVASALATKPEEPPLEHILTTIENYLNNRSKDHLDSTRVWLSEDSTVQMDYLDSLWVQIKNFRANNWVEAFLNRPFNDREYRDDMAASINPQNLPTIQIPPHSPDYVYPKPRIVLRLYEDDVMDGERSIPGSDKIERFCIENYIRNVIDENINDVKVCPRHLTSMQRHDKLPMKHLLIETIVGEMFCLPKPKHDLVLYHVLLAGLRRNFNPHHEESTYDAVLSEAVMVLYENMETMNITCFNRLVDWFSFHLNSIEYLFVWKNFANAAKKKPSIRATFVQELLSSCVRFSFHKKVKTLVSSDLDELMPPEVRVEYLPTYAEHSKAEDLAAQIKALIVEKADGPTISKSLNLKIDGVELPDDFILEEEKPLDSLMKIDIFTAVIITLACKSLTHLSSAIGKYRNVFKAMTRVEGGQVQLLHTMQSCLKDHPHLQVILVDKLLKAELINSKSICEWIFSTRMRSQTLKLYPWEILNNTVRRTLLDVKKLTDAKVAAPAVQVKIEKPDNEAQAGDVDGDVEMQAEADAAAAAAKEASDLDEKLQRARSVSDDLMSQVFIEFANLVEHISQTTSDQFCLDFVAGQMQFIYYNFYDTLQPKHDEIRALIGAKVPDLAKYIINLNK